MTMSLGMDCSSSFNQQNNHGTMDEQKGGIVDDVFSSNSDDVSSVVSSDSDLFEEEEEEEEEVTSSGSSSPTSPSSGSSSSSGQLANGPLQDMSSLLQELPFKKGLSKHYNGKSQSFTSLANVRCLEDLAKPENPYNKRLKSCKSYGLLESYRSSQPHRSASSSRLISKKAASSRGSCSSLLTSVKRNASFLGNRPPIPPPHRSTSTTSFTNQTPLFA